MRALATVTRLSPRDGSYDLGLAAYRTSHFDTAIAELSRVQDLRSQFLLTRAYLRANRIEDALSTVWATRKDLTHGELAERSLLIGIAETRLKAFEEARASFGEASAYAMSVDSPALVAEIEYYQSLLAFARGNLKEFSLRAHAIIDRHSVAAASDEYVIPLAHTRARAFEALDASAVIDRRMCDAVPLTERAIAELDQEPIVDTWILTQNYLNLAVRARDLDLAGQAAFLKDRIDKIEWSEPLRSRHFTILTALGWCDALAGNHVGALSLFRRATAVAPGEPERIAASLSRVSLALELDHGILADEELFHALDLSTRVDWERCLGDYRLVLLQLAQVAANRAPRESRRALDRYRNLRSSLSTLSVARLEPRYRGEEAFAEGRVSRAEGDVDLAKTCLRAAFECWYDLGLQWRAALAAIELAELGDRDQYARFARFYAARRPLSWIARRASAL